MMPTLSAMQPDLQALVNTAGPDNLTTPNPLLQSIMNSQQGHGTPGMPLIHPGAVPSAALPAGGVFVTFHAHVVHTPLCSHGVWMLLYFSATAAHSVSVVSTLVTCDLQM